MDMQQWQAPPPGGGMDQDSGMVPSEAVADLRGIKEACDAKLAEAESARFGAANETEVFRAAQVRKVMAALSEAGVDPSDPQSISNFREQLYRRDPDLLTMFDEGMRRLLGEEDPPPEEAMMQPEDAMMQPEGVMMQPEGAMMQPEGAMMQPEGAMMQPEGAQIQA